MKSLGLLGNRLPITRKQSHMETGGKAVDTTLILYPIVYEHEYVNILHMWNSLHSLPLRKMNTTFMKYSVLLLMDSP